jgi:hypothetical protein
VFGNMLYTYVVVTVCIKAGLECHCSTLPLQIAIWGSIGGWFVFLALYSRVWPTLPIASEMRGVGTMVYSSGVFWAGLVLIPLVTLLPDITWKALQRTISPTYLDRLLQSTHRQNARHDAPARSGTDRSESNQNSVLVRWLTVWRDFCGWTVIGSQSGPNSGGRRRRSSGLLINAGLSSTDGNHTNIQQQPMPTTPQSPPPTDGSPLHFVGTLNVTRRPVSGEVSSDHLSHPISSSTFVRRPSVTPNEQLQDELRYGYAFSQEEHGGVSQSQLIHVNDAAARSKRN